MPMLESDSCVFGREYLQLSYYMFIPGMAFYKICAGVSLQQIASAWPLVLYPSIFAGVGFVLGTVMTRLLKIESKQLRHSITLTLMFGNYGSLPFSILQTITKDVSPFAEDLLSSQRSLAYSSIFMSTASLWLWSFGPWYIRRSRSAPLESTEAGQVEEASESSNSHKESSEGHDSAVELNDLSHANDDDHLTNGSASATGHTQIDAFQPRLPFRHRAVARAKAIFRSVRNWGVWGLITPSTIACILAVLLVAAAPVHKLFFVPVTTTTSTTVSTPSVSNLTEIAPDGTVTCLEAPVAAAAYKPPFQFLADTINTVGVCCIPVALLLLGSNLYSTVKGQVMRYRMRNEPQDSVDDLDDPLHRAPGSGSVLPLPKRVLIGAVVGRLVILPIICFFISWVVLKIGILPSDPLIAMVLVIEGCMPSAINLVILAQMQDDQAVTEQLATILLGQYVFCTFTIFTVIAVGIRVFL